MEEQFLDVVGYEDIFQVSNTGKVFSKRTNRVLKTAISKSGYSLLSTKIGGRLGRAYLFRVHRLVAEAFLPNPDNKPEVNHIDGNKLNNSVSNLEWATHKENMSHAAEAGLLGQSIVNNISKSKLTDEQVKEIRLSALTNRQLAETYKVSANTIFRVKNRLSYKHIT